MKTPRMTRRQFFKLSTLGVAPVALSGLAALGVPLPALAAVDSPPGARPATPQHPEGLAIMQPTFNPIASSTLLGPPTDLSMGWDGTLWAIDASGAPHIYDAVQDAWQLHGDGIDAAALVLGDAQYGETVYVFRGPDYVTLNPTTFEAGAPGAIAQRWPNLPDSFKMGVNGAALGPDIGGIILFNGGRYVVLDGAGNVTTPATSLTSLTGWPQTPNWINGVIDGVWSNTSVEIYLLHGAEALPVDISTGTVLGAPISLSQAIFIPDSPADWASGVDASAGIDDIALTFKDAAVFVWKGPNAPGGASQSLQYIGAAFGNWPAAWHPVLAHAPNGRDGSLWSVLPSERGSYIVQHDGDGWTQQVDQADHVAAGQDGTVMIASAEKIWRWTGSGWNELASLSGLTQVSLGDAASVWGRDASNNVHRFDTTNNTFSLATEVGAATHMAANADGTLWHCKPSDPSLHRFLADENVLQSGIAVKQSVVTNVLKVAAAGFGAAHCLAQQANGTQVYRYDSPYIFKTSGDYHAQARGQIAQGLGMLFFTDIQVIDLPDHNKTAVVALDAHTGQELSRSAWLEEPNSVHGDPVFDPVSNLVYVGTRNSDNPYDGSTPGHILALDPRDLSHVVWHYASSPFGPVYGIEAAPAVLGATLLVSDRSGTIYAFDTLATKANPAHPTPVGMWSAVAVSGLGANVVLSPPLLVDGYYRLTMWALPDVGDQDPSFYAYDVQIDPTLDPSAPNAIVVRLQPLHIFASGWNSSHSIYPLMTSPLAVKVSAGANGPAPTQLYMSGGDAVVWIKPDLTTATFNLPSGTFINTGLAWDPDTQQIWFGDDQGMLHALDASLRPVGHTPVALGSGPNRAIFTTPVIYKDPQGDKTVLVGVLDPNTSTPSLYGVDPDTGNVASVPTGATNITSLSNLTGNGVIYAAGLFDLQAVSGAFSQVFGIRVDDLPQAERDFIIESQLMQDPDQNAANGSTDQTNPIPPSVARYQTHLTVVDDQRAAIPHEPVKIWADVANTKITVGGVLFTIGPGDAQFASVMTGADGSLVIVSDATDINTSALRVWASFMNPYERIVVYPDHEWHGRASQSYATPGEASPDPGKPNLSTAYNYKGAQLFSDDEKTQNAPQNVASAVGQMNQGLKPAGNNPAALAGKLKTLHASNAQSQYVAFTNLAGMHYAPSNARAKRTAQPVSPFGLQMVRTTNGATHTPLSHADARSAIDGLTGTPWDPNNPPGASGAGAASGAASGGQPVTFVVQRGENIFTDFWNWLVGAIESVVNAIEQVIVSVAEDIVVGIQFLINGVAHVFKAIIKVVEDVVNAIGSFFLQLAKLIEDMIEALSVLFHFGEIMKTHRWMRDQINANLQAAVSAMQNQVKQEVDSFFEQGEQAIQALFSSARQSLGLNTDTQVNDLNGGRSTAHTAFSAKAGAAGPNSGGDSHAVQCTHTSQKLKDGLPSSTPSLAARRSPAQSDDDDAVLSQFVTGFADSLQNDPVISSAFTTLKNAIDNLGASRSANDFFKSALNVLLTTIEDLILGMVAVTHALTDGLIQAIQALINTALSLMNTPVDIPVLSWLYQTVFGEPLTILNAMTLVAAIPVTVIYRVVEGHYPSADGIDGVRAGASQPQQQTVSADVLKKMQGLIGGTIALGLGIVRGVVDEAGANPPRIGTIFVLTFGVCYVSTYFPLMIPGVTPNSYTWAGWGLGMSLALLGTFGVLNLKGASQNVQLYVKRGLTFFRVCLAIARMSVYIVGFIKAGNTNAISDLTFTRNLFLELPPMLNWLKLLGARPADLALTVIDIVTGVVVCALDIAVVYVTTATQAHIYYFPRMLVNSALPGAER